MDPRPKTLLLSLLAIPLAALAFLLYFHFVGSAPSESSSTVAAKPGASAAMPCSSAVPCPKGFVCSTRRIRCDVHPESSTCAENFCAPVPPGYGEAPSEFALYASYGPDDSPGIRIRMAWPAQGRSLWSDLSGAEWQRLLNRARESALRLRSCYLDGRNCSFSDGSIVFSLPATDLAGAKSEGEILFRPASEGGWIRIPFSATVQSERLQ